jgi:hypothetical protein
MHKLARLNLSRKIIELLDMFEKIKEIKKIWKRKLIVEMVG